MVFGYYFRTDIIENLNHPPSRLRKAKARFLVSNFEAPMLQVAEARHTQRLMKFSMSRFAAAVYQIEPAGADASSVAWPVIGYMHEASICESPQTRAESNYLVIVARKESHRARHFAIAILRRNGSLEQVFNVSCAIPFRCVHSLCNCHIRREW